MYSRDWESLIQQPYPQLLALGFCCQRTQRNGQHQHFLSLLPSQTSESAVTLNLTPGIVNVYSVSSLLVAVWSITFRQLMLTSMTASCYVFFFRFVWLLLTWVTYKWQRKWLNHYSGSARTNRAAKLPYLEVAWSAAFPNAIPMSLHFLFSFKILTVRSDIFLFIAYLCQLPWYELTVPAVVWGDKKYFS